MTDAGLITPSIFALLLAAVLSLIDFFRALNVRLDIDSIQAAAGDSRESRGKTRELIVTFLATLASAPLVALSTAATWDLFQEGEVNVATILLVATTLTLVLAGAFGIRYLRDREKDDYQSYPPILRDLQDLIAGASVDLVEVSRLEDALLRLRARSRLAMPARLGQRQRDRWESTIAAIVSDLGSKKGSVGALVKAHSRKWDALPFLVGPSFLSLVAPALAAVSLAATIAISSNVPSGFVNVWVTIAIVGIAASTGIALFWSSGRRRLLLGRAAASRFLDQECAVLIGEARARDHERAVLSLASRLRATLAIWLA